MSVRCLLPLLAFAIISQAKISLVENKIYGVGDLRGRIKRSAGTCEDYQCNDGECYPRSEKCDGVPYCFDESDEWNCDDVCDEEEFRCVSDGKCMPRSKICNRVKDCEDGSDEIDCIFKQTCSEDDFSCHNGKCIFHMLVCDGLDHCGDNSDEFNCTKASCSRNFFDCYGDGRKCINVEKLCDSRKDCQNGEDETDCGALNNDEHPWKGGNDFPDSQDKEEETKCGNSHHCHHNCVRRSGLDICGCYSGFFLAEDGRTCKSEVEPHLWLANGSKLIEYGIYTRDVTNQYDLVYGISTFTLGHEENLVFWSSESMDTIRMSYITKHRGVEKTETLIRSPNTQAITALAYDWTSRNLYWAEMGKESPLEEDQRNSNDASKISILSLDDGNGGRMHAPILVSPQVHSPNTLVVDPRSEARHLYWTQIGKHAGLFRSDMDGSNITSLAKPYVKHPVSLTIDIVYDLLAWLEGESGHLYVNLLHGGISHVMTIDRLSAPVALAAFESSVYLGGDKEENFKEVKMWMDGHAVDSLPKLATVKTRSMAVGHASLQPVDPDSAKCAGNKCDHICIPLKSGFVCRCHDSEVQKMRGASYELAADKETCSMKQVPNKGFPVKSVEPSTSRPSLAPNWEVKNIETTGSMVLSEGEVAHGARQKGNDDDDDDGSVKHAQASNNGNKSEVTLGVAWIYFTLASLVLGVIALIGVGAYKLKTSRDNRKVRSKEVALINKQHSPAPFSNLPM